MFVFVFLSIFCLTPCSWKTFTGGQVIHLSNVNSFVFLVRSLLMLNTHCQYFVSHQFLLIFCLTSCSWKTFLGGSSYPSVQCQQCCIFLVRSLLMLYTHCQWPYCIYSCKDKSVLYNMENPFCVILINMFCIVWLNLFCIICRVRFLYDVDEFVLYNMDESDICIIWINTPWSMFSIKYGKSAMYTTEESAICIIWIYIIG